MIATLGTAIRAVYGPLPYHAVVILVELLKMVLAVDLATLNASYIVQFFIIFNFSWIHQVKDITIQAVTLLSGLIAYLPILIDLIMVRLFEL